MAMKSSFRELSQAIVGVIPDGLPEPLVDQWVRHPEILSKVLRGALGTFPKMAISYQYVITVNYKQTVEWAVKLGKYQSVDANITSEHFPSKESGKIQVVTVYLTGFDHFVKSEEVISEMDRLALRPATLKELLALGISRPDLQVYNPIVALGSLWPEFDGTSKVVCLDSLGLSRSLDLFRFFGGDWREESRFLALRK